MTKTTCPDCDKKFARPNGFWTERGLICPDCATDPDNPNTPDDIEPLEQIEIMENTDGVVDDE